MMPRRTLQHGFPFLLAVSLVAAPAVSDTVHLVNGETFEDVVAVGAGEQVRILMAGGEMRLAASQVLRIEEADSPYRRFLTRREELAGDPGATAAAWTELARQALAAGLLPAARQAAQAAAARDPELPALAALMDRLGYVRDELLGDWVPAAEHRRRTAAADPAAAAAEEGDGEGLAGRRQADAAWRAERARLAAAEARLEAEGARLAAERAELSSRRRESEESGWRQPGWEWAGPGAGVAVVYTLPAPIAVIDPGLLPPTPSTQPGQGQTRGGPVMSLFERQPGSLIPGEMVVGPLPPRRP